MARRQRRRYNRRVDASSARSLPHTTFAQQPFLASRWISICLLGISVLVSACASPTAPERSLQNMSGAWQGQWQITRCNMSRNCAMLVGTTVPYTMRLLQSGTHVDGVVNVFGTVNVSGTMLPDGSVTFTGSKPAASDFDPTGDGRITEFTIHPDAQRGFVGSYAYENVHTVEQSHDTSPWMVQGNILNAARTSSIVSGNTSFAGHWVGGFVIRTCVPVGWTSCYPSRTGELLPFDLRLDQSGSGVSGTMAFLPVNGTFPVTGVITSNRLVLAGEFTSLAAGFPVVVRLMSWSTTRDDIGGMAGIFSYRHETHWMPPRPPVAVWTFDYDAELVSVVLQQ